MKFICKYCGKELFPERKLDAVEDETYIVECECQEIENKTKYTTGYEDGLADNNICSECTDKCEDIKCSMRLISKSV